MSSINYEMLMSMEKLLILMVVNADIPEFDTNDFVWWIDTDDCSMLELIRFFIVVLFLRSLFVFLFNDCSCFLV